MKMEFGLQLRKRKFKKIIRDSEETFKLMFRVPRWEGTISAKPRFRSVPGVTDTKFATPIRAAHEVPTSFKGLLLE